MRLTFQAVMHRALHISLIIQTVLLPPMPRAKRHSKNAYSPKAGKKVAEVMHEYKRGTLKSGQGKHPKVKSRKQAIAIGLSEARKEGARVPPPKKALHKLSI